MLKKDEILCTSFNQDYSQLAVGYRSGYRLLSLSASDKLEEIFSAKRDDVGVVERLFSSSLVALVSKIAPCKLNVCHFKKGSEICNYSYSNAILAVRLNRLRLVVCLEESIYIHNIRDMKVLHTIRNIPANPQGLCALSISNERCFLAYPASNQIGEVQIFDALTLKAITLISAHNSNLAAFTFNSTATRFATASVKGTVIRVFSAPDGQKLVEFRRGVKRCVSIQSLAFSSDSTFLASTSNTETVHVFSLQTASTCPLTPSSPSSEVMAAASTAAAADTAHSAGWVEWAARTTASYLPALLTSQDRAFATARLPPTAVEIDGKDRTATCAFVMISLVPYLVVASSDGWLHVFRLDTQEGGECAQISQLSLWSSAAPQMLDCPTVESQDSIEKGKEFHFSGCQTYAEKVRLGSLNVASDASLDSAVNQAELDADVVSTPKFLSESLSSPALHRQVPEFFQLKLCDDTEFPPVGV